ncbi:MAG TPA: hypothetical protein VG501_10830 [Rhizomicrobium sp.]|nr:hypothetical protein [Rhizomicrobium sp.]
MKRVIPLCVAVMLAGFCGTAFADSRSAVLGRLAHCNEIQDSRTWLDCYYAAAQPERAELGLAPAPQAPVFETLFGRSAPPGAAPTTAGGPPSDDGGFFSMFSLNAAKVPPEQFGLTNARPGPGLNVDRIVEKVSSYSFAGGKFTVTLANGQVWRQTGGPTATWRSTPANYTATVTYGALHTFNLRVQDGRYSDNTLYKVERIH